MASLHGALHIAQMASLHGALHIAHMASLHGALHCASIEHILCVPVRALCAHREFRTRRHSSTTIKPKYLRVLCVLCASQRICCTRRHSSTIINHQISLCPLCALCEKKIICVLCACIAHILSHSAPVSITNDAPRIATRCVSIPVCGSSSYSPSALGCSRQ